LDFIGKHKAKILIGITFVMIVLIFITSVFKDKATFVGDGLGYVVAPTQKYLGRFGDWVGSKISFWQNINDLQTQKDELNFKVEELQNEINRLKLYENENKKLSELLDLRNKYKQYSTTASEVIGKEPGNWYEIFTIDKGNKKNIEADMVVLAQKGLVGRIIETNDNYSKVMSIIDDRSSVPAKNLRTDDVGVVKGDYTLMKDGLCKMEYIDADAEIIVGDEIVTSHLSQIYPVGITIGYIKEIKMDKNGLTKYAIIEPVIDFKHIENVLIINKKANYLSEDVEE
jgi:rod shape-determining protein MreC